MADDREPWDPALATRQLHCERCGTGFGCRDRGEEGSCWCSREAFRMPLPDGTGPYVDCLCPSCLREVAGELREIAPKETP